MANLIRRSHFVRASSRYGLHEYSFTRKQSLGFGMQNPSVFVKHPVEMMFYRVRKDRSGLFFGLKIDTSSDALKYLDVTFTLYPAHLRYSILARWRAGIQLTGKTTTVEVALDHPRLNIENQGGRKQEAHGLLHKSEGLRADPTLYVLSASCAGDLRESKIQTGNRIIFCYQ